MACRMADGKCLEYRTIPRFMQPHFCSEHAPVATLYTHLSCRVGSVRDPLKGVKLNIFRGRGMRLSILLQIGR